MIAPHYLAGHMLLALPGIGDARFDRAVIAMCLHDANGAFGVGVGELCSNISLHGLLEDIGIDPGVAPDAPVLRGGPVSPQQGFVLHSPDWQDEQTIAATSLCCLSASPAILRAIAEGQGPERYLVALGYAGWGAGQLDAEMRLHGWHAATGSEAVLFGTPAERRWAASWHAEGIDPALLTSQTGRA